MPAGRNPLPDLDERTSRIGRELYAQVRETDAAEREAMRREVDRKRSDGGTDAGDGISDWLFGDGDAGGDGGD